MKRHPSLQGLSRDHHRILLHAQELHWAARGVGDLLNSFRQFLDFWDSEGRGHFTKEEKILFPYCETCRRWKSTKAVDLVFAYHQQVRERVEKLKQKVRRGHDLMRIVRDLSELLELQVRHEERVVFEEIQATLSEGELVRLEESLASSPET